MQPDALVFLKQRTGIRACLYPLLIAACVFLPSGFAAAVTSVSGNWTAASDGSWNESENWSRGRIASGPSATADFSTIDIPGDTTVTLDKNITVGTLIFGDKNTASAGGWTISGNTLTLNTLSINGNPATTPTVTVNDLGTGKTATITSTLAGNQGLAKNGTGTLTLGGIISNTYTGNTTVNVGTLALDKAKGAAAIVGTSITINSRGTLLLQASDQIANTTNLTLNGGSTFSTGTGFNETLGAVTLTGDSIISLGNSIHLLGFGDSTLKGWSPTAKLTIYGWSGTAGLSGTSGEIFFGNNSSTLTGDQLANINFIGFDPGAKLLSTGELVPNAVPETGTYVAGLLLVGLVAWRERKRFVLAAAGAVLSGGRLAESSLPDTYRDR